MNAIYLLIAIVICVWVFMTRRTGTESDGELATTPLDHEARSLTVMITAAIALLGAAVASFGGVLLGAAAFAPKNSSAALLFFFLIPAGAVLGFAGAIYRMRGSPSSGARNVGWVFWAFVLSFAFGAGVTALMTRLECLMTC